MIKNFVQFESVLTFTALRGKNFKLEYSREFVVKSVPRRGGWWWKGGCYLKLT